MKYFCSPTKIAQDFYHWTTNEKTPLKAIYCSDTNSYHDGVLFFKPEVCVTEPVFLKDLLCHLYVLSQKYGVIFSSVFGISGRFLYDNDIINSLYDKISFYANIYKPGPPVLIGSECLIKKGVDPNQLFQTWVSSKNITKLKEGFYITPYELEQRSVMLINGFYPHQVSHYKKNGHNILLFFFTTSTSFELLKQEFQGSILSIGPHSESMRGMIYKNAQWFKPFQIFSSQNGFHLSENKKEGNREGKLFADLIDSTIFERR